MIRSTLFLALALGLSAPALAEDTVRAPMLALKAVTADDVGDADSFGKTVKWLGLVSGYVSLAPDCTPTPGDPADPNCVTLNPVPALTSFNLTDLDVLNLPRGATETLICHWQTPIGSVGFFNPTAGTINYRLQVTPVYRIESDVLIGLNDPNTGLPYNGVIELPLTGVLMAGQLAPGEFIDEYISGTRMCIGGLVTKSALINQYGLTEGQANRFFRRQVTIRLGIRGNAQGVEYASVNIGTRFVGDRLIETVE